jgi:hypothetical protein
MSSRSEKYMSSLSMFRLVTTSSFPYKSSSKQYARIAGSEPECFVKRTVPNVNAREVAIPITHGTSQDFREEKGEAKKKVGEVRHFFHRINPFTYVKTSWHFVRLSVVRVRCRYKREFLELEGNIV